MAVTVYEEKCLFGVCHATRSNYDVKREGKAEETLMDDIDMGRRGSIARMAGIFLGIFFSFSLVFLSLSPFCSLGFDTRAEEACRLPWSEP